MSDTFSFDTTIRKDSATRGSWQLPVVVAENVKNDAGLATVDIAAGDTLILGLQGLAQVDVLLLLTPSEVLLTCSHATGAITSMPVTNTFVLSSRAITGVSIENAGSASVKISYAILERVST